MHTTINNKNKLRCMTLGACDKASWHIYLLLYNMDSNTLYTIQDVYKYIIELE